MKIMLYDQSHGKDSRYENERAKGVFMSRDERVFRMASIKNKPNTIQFMTNEIFDHHLVGESEIIQGDVLLIVDQGTNYFQLPYSLRYNKMIRKPELFIEKSIERAKDVLESTNDICSANALLEFLARKGIPESSIWIFSVLLRTKLMKQIGKCIILANTIKRIVEKEVFVMSNFPKLTGFEKKNNEDSDDNSENDEAQPGLFVGSIMFVLENIMKNNLEEESKLAKNILMTLFFYRLESLPFHNGLQFDIDTKEYLQGQEILKDILSVSVENPLLLLKTVQSIGNVNFSLELIRKCGVDKYMFIQSNNPLQIDFENDEPNVSAPLINYAPVTIRERMYFIMAIFISSKEYIDLNESNDDFSRKSANSSSVKNSYLDRDSEESDDEEESSQKSDQDDEDEEEDASNESYDSVASLNNENSPPFKQAKFEKQNKQINSVYSSRMSMISSHDNVLRASTPLMNLQKNYIEVDNEYKKCQYLSKIFLQLPSSLYRLKLMTIELDSKDASKFSEATQQIEHADFLQEFSILRQNYSLQSLDDLNKLVLFLESIFKDIFTVEGDESAFLEILMINSIVLFIGNKFDEIYKNLERGRTLLYGLFKCPLEIISLMQMFTGIAFEKENIIESEKEYLLSLIHYFPVISDPRGRGTYSSNYLLALTWKASMMAHYYKKEIDAELCEELLDSTLYNLETAKAFEAVPTSAPEDEGPSKKLTHFSGQAPTKSKFSGMVHTKVQNPVSRNSNTKIKIDDIDVEMLSNFINDTGDPYDDYKYTQTENRFLFYHWARYKEKIEDIEDFMKYGAGNQLDFFIFLLRANPGMYLSGDKFNHKQIRDFTFNSGPDSWLNLKTTSSIMSGREYMSSSYSQASFSSTLSTTVKEKRQKSLYHGAYQHILNKDHFALSRGECNGVAYVWGTDLNGQLGCQNVANMKQESMEDELRRYYPRILIGLKDLMIKEICCGNDHSLAVTLEGHIYAWGNNKEKQLGIGYNSPEFVSQPTRVYNIKNVTSVSCGYEHSMALTSEGELYSWGHGEGGLLGHGELDDEATPKLIEEFQKKDLTVSKVYGGGLHTLAIAGDGDLYSWGRGEGGQLGHSKKHLEELERLDLGISVPIGIINDKTIVDITGGAAHSLALTEAGQVYSWGHNNYGQGGLGFSGENFEPGTGNAESGAFEPTLIKSLSKTKIVNICAGSTFSMFLSEDEELYACGINDLGQGGIDTSHEELQKFKDIKNKKAHNFETNSDISAPRKLECFYGMEVKGVAGGEDHSFAVINSGEKNKKMLWGWGQYKSGQLGLGRLKQRNNPRLLQTLYNANILQGKISGGSKNTLCIIGDPEIYKSELDSDASEMINKSYQIDFEHECWNIVEHQDEENFQLKMAEYN